MLDNLIFSLNATLPIFIMMVLGYILKRINLINEPVANGINKLVFRVFLPALLFYDLSKQDFVNIWDSVFVLFCMLSTILSILISALLAKIFCKSCDKGEFIQASFRSAAATLGIAFMTNVYDNVAMVSLMIIGSVPIYNIVSVILLSLTSKETKPNQSFKETIKKTLFNLVTNPIILGILAGFMFTLLPFEMPKIVDKSVSYLANVASPLALIGLGASFEFSNIKENSRALSLVIFNKLILFCLLFLPVCVLLGFRDEKIVAALIMLGTATTSSSFIMAKNMGHDGHLSCASVMVTTLLSSFTLTFWLFILRTFGYI
ncbi:MAG: AEC family transporter [Lachnospiraceae bacterium]|nr:AEC family transporter [Lachnospiraceae bacterium]